MPDDVVIDGRHPFAVLRLTRDELIVLLALTKLGMAVYKSGVTDETTARLDSLPRPIFAALAGKIGERV